MQYFLDATTQDESVALAIDLEEGLEGVTIKVKNVKRQLMTFLFRLVSLYTLYIVIFLYYVIYSIMLTKIW